MFQAPSRYKALYGGRGSAKSHFFGEAMIGNAVAAPGLRAVCIREVQKSLKDSAKLLLEDKIEAMGVGQHFDIQNDQIKTKGGGLIIFQGMQDHTAESIKSLEGFNIAWCEEAQTLSERSLELLRPTIRVPGSEIWASWNPRAASDAVDKFFRGKGGAPDNTLISRISYQDNKFFPDELEKERLHDKKTKPDRYAHIWLGEYEPQAVGAIWNRQVIEDNRRVDSQELRDGLERILVAIDPAVSDNEDHTNNEHGIVVGGMDAGKHGYLLEDASMHGSPHQWATRAVAMFDKWEADAVVIEKNQGGDMCKYTLQTIRKSLPVIEVHATRGKHVRAEPISALYPVGRVSHVGSFPDLEDQLCLFTASGWEGDEDKSPDRAEAWIWLCTELFPAMTTPRGKSRPAQHHVDGGWMGG
jgi:phage terminase large subunit-like protein|tara:strand:- start:19399 stop:20637 length:1239 start_codon:yes stop_codon:yes gene_type:complete